MSSRTTIEWTQNTDGTPGTTWNPTTGCDQVSPGCDHCYALTLAGRLKAMGAAKYQRDGDPRTSGPGFGLAVHEDTLLAPLSWRRPRTVFVNSMSDLFHADVGNDFIARVFAVMALTPQHTYQVLTKRHARLRALMRSGAFTDAIRAEATVLRTGGAPLLELAWPLPNVWMGISAEDQRWADIRIPALTETPAAVRFVSAEPLLGPVAIAADHTSRLDWVIIGGESGPGARPREPEWARALRDQAQAAGAATFVKQLGATWAREHGGDRKGGDPARWPEDLRVREMPRLVRGATT